MHYVVSDIHGQYDKFCQLLKKIRFSQKDEMYIIGDVIDRGPRSADTLMHILVTENIHLLIGNHEHMMIQAAASKDVTLWSQNGGKGTIREMKNYSNASMESVIEALKHCPIIIPDLEVKGRKFYLVHACPPDIILDKELRYDEADEKTISCALWDRRVCEFGTPPKEFLSEEVGKHYKDHIFLVGHTPTAIVSFGDERRRAKSKIISGCGGRIMNLDCGCAMNRKLGCLRLEDMKEFYV